MTERSLARRMPRNQRVQIPTGTKFSNLTVIGETLPSIHKSGQKRRRIVCRCICGDVTVKMLDYMKNGRSRDCGCISMRNRCKFSDESKKYGFLQPFGRQIRKNGNSAVNCKCDCGEKIIVYLTHLQSGNTRSCGKCGLTGRVRHGFSGMSEYSIWNGMKYRCTNKSNPAYKYYGGRGITVCDRWMESFDNFINDMGRKPEGTSLDRIDVNKGYSPDNCRWATDKEQAVNKQRHAMIEWRGAAMSVSDFSQMTGITILAISTIIVSGAKDGDEIIKKFSLGLEKMKNLI